MTSAEFCFLCRKKLNASSITTNIGRNFCQASKKPIKNVINHLAQCNNTEVHISKEEVLCCQCHSLIIDYDKCLVALLQKQKKLSELIENALMAFDDIDVECSDDKLFLEEIGDEGLYDDIQISDCDVVQRINIFSGRNVRSSDNSHIKEIPSFIPLEPQCELLQCTLCAMRFRSKIRLHKHIANAHKKYSCQLCDYNHRNEDYVKLHMNLHEGKSENQCRYCDKEFSTKISTMRHMEVHMDTKKYQCDKCGLCFSQTTVMYNHKLQHEAEEQPLRCDICAQVFKTKRTFRHHMITHQANRPRHSCEYCGKTFTEKYTLKVHKKSHHESGRSTEKYQNLYELKQKQLLNVMIDNHDQQSLDLALTSSFNPTEVETKHYSKTFNRKDHLNKDLENDHDVILESFSVTDYNPYDVDSNSKSCNICGQAFVSSALEYHILNMHSND